MSLLLSQGAGLHLRRVVVLVLIEASTNEDRQALEGQHMAEVVEDDLDLQGIAHLLQGGEVEVEVLGTEVLGQIQEAVQDHRVAAVHDHTRLVRVHGRRREEAEAADVVDMAPDTAALLEAQEVFAVEEGVPHTAAIAVGAEVQIGVDEIIARRG